MFSYQDVMEDKELTLTDVIAQVVQAEKMNGKLATQYAEVLGSFAGIREEIMGSADQVL